MAHLSGFTRASTLGPIADFVHRQGGSIVRVFQGVDLPLKLIQAPDTPIPLRLQFRLLERAARETGDPLFGARLGQHVRARDLGALGLWATAADNLEEAIRRCSQGLSSMLQTSTALKLEFCGPAVRWSMELLDLASEGRWQHEQLALCYMLDLIRCYAGRSWSPELVLTTEPEGGERRSLEQLHRASVFAGQRLPAIQFDANLLSSRRLRKGTASEPDGLASGCPEPALPEDGDEVAALTAVMELSLLNGYPRLDWVASKLGATRRSLQRRLHAHGTTFAKVAELVLRDRAKHLLAGTNIPITSIAYELGYTDTAHFSRAFKKWTGVSPSDYRSRQPDSAP